jgi:hypothetical protein
MPKTKKIWISNDTGRSFLGWKIKEEIFAIFFILVILALSNDKKIVEKVTQNVSIQMFIFIIFIYCVYNKIPWSLAFIMVFIFAFLFSDFINNVKGSLNKIFLDIKNNNDFEKKDTALMTIGAKVLGWISKDSKVNINKNDTDNKNDNINKNDKNDKDVKSILKKKVRFDIENKIDKDEVKDVTDEADVTDEVDNSSDDDVCKKVSELFNLDDETDGETDNESEIDNSKDDLKSFMKNSL